MQYLLLYCSEEKKFTDDLFWFESFKINILEELHIIWHS